MPILSFIYFSQVPYIAGSNAIPAFQAVGLYLLWNENLNSKRFFVCLFILPWAVVYLFFLYYSCIFQKILLLLGIILFQRCTVEFFQAFLQVSCSKRFIIFVFYFRTTPSLSRFSLKTSSALSRLEQLLCVTWNTPVNIFHTDYWRIFASALCLRCFVCELLHISVIIFFLMCSWLSIICHSYVCIWVLLLNYSTFHFY